MANINWPNPTSVGQIYVSDNGDSWKWTGNYWQSVGASSISGSGATNQVTLWSGTGSLTGSSRIGYTDSPGSDVRISISDSGYGSVLGRGFVEASVNSGGATNVIRSASNSNGVAPVIELKKSRNTLAVPNTVTNGTYLGEVQYTGAFDSIGGYKTSVSIRSEASETWSPTTAGTKFSINTISNASNTQSEKFSIGGDGFIRFYNLYSFPVSNGSINQVLTTNGAGTLSWSTITAAGLGAVTGAGTGNLNYVPKWLSGGASLGNSLISDDGSGVFINTTPGAYTGNRLTVFNSTVSNNAVKVLSSAAAITNNTITGIDIESKLTTSAFGSRTVGASILANGAAACNTGLSIGVNGSFAPASGANFGIISAIVSNSNVTDPTNIASYNYIATLTSANPSIGVYSEVSVNSGSGGRYSVQLKDGTETVAGRFLKNMTTDGKGNWANITTADVSGSVLGAGTGSSSRLTLWSNTNTITSDANLTYSTVSGDSIITVNGTNNRVQIGATESGIYSTNTNSQFFLRTTKLAGGIYPVIDLTAQRSSSPGFEAGNTDVLFEIRGKGGQASVPSIVISGKATENNDPGTNAGAELSFKTNANGQYNATPLTRLRITSAGAIRFNEAYTFPTADGSSPNSFLITNGTGTLSWATPTALSIPSGSGTPGFVTRWINANTQGSGIIQDDTTTIGINVTPNTLYRTYIKETLSNRVSLRVENSHTASTANTIAGSFYNNSVSTGNFTNYGISLTTSGSTALNVGIESIATTNTTGGTAISGIFDATGSGQKYSLRLKDGTQGAGKFLKSITTDGHANWASLTTADVSGSITGAGASNYLAYWSNASNLTYDGGLTISPGTNPELRLNAYSPGNTGQLTMSPQQLKIVSSAGTPSLQLTAVGNAQPQIFLGRYLAGTTNLVDQNPIGIIQWTNSGVNSASISTKAEGNFSSGTNIGTSLRIGTASRNAGTTITDRFIITGGFLNALSDTYQSPQVQIKNSTFEVGVVTPEVLVFTGNRKYQMEVTSTDSPSGILSKTAVAGSGSGGDFVVSAIVGQSSASAGDRIGVYGIAGSSTTSNIGIKGEVNASGTGSVSVGGHFVVPTGATAYSLWLQDGTQSPGRVLKCLTVDGKARWAEPEPYKVYTAIITQTGTAAPVVNVLRNTLTSTPTVQRLLVGAYRLASADFNNNSKVWCSISSNREDTNGLFTIVTFSGLVQIYSSIISGGGVTDVDGILNAFIEIRVYP